MTEQFPIWTTTVGDTITATVRRAVEKFGDKQFLDFLGSTYSYKDLDRESSRMANGLAALGVSKGQTVVCLLDNSDQFVFLWLGIMKLGAICVPVNTAYKGEYLRHQVADAGASVIVAETDYAERIVGISHDLPEMATLVFRGEAPSGEPAGKKMVPFDTLLVDDTTLPVVDIAPSDLAFLIYTGGTTGPSKGCMISHNYACVLSHQIGVGTGRHEGSRSWTSLPMFHFNAFTNTFICTLQHGASCALYPRFSVSNFWPEIERTQSNDAILLGSMFAMILNASPCEAEERWRGKLVTIGGAPFPSPYMKAWKERFKSHYTVCPGYGFTEASLVTLVSAEDSHLAAPDSSGRLNKWFDVRIVDDEDREVPVGTPGEIIVRPRMPNVMFDGYWRRPAETLRIMKDLWLHTGDIGKFDEDGWFFFVDRKKDYLRRRGENISSFEVENVFRKHPEIDDIAAHAVISDMGEDDLKITVVLKAEATVTEEALFHWSADKMPYFAVPRFIEFRDHLPKSPVGRVLKYELRDQGVTPQTWDQEKAGVTIKKR